MNLTRFQAHHSKEAGLISQEAFITIDQVFGYIMLIISSLGVVTNVINIRTFIVMGLRDGVSISLLGLSISDLGVTLFSCVLSSSLVIGALEMRYDLKYLPIHPSVFILFSANISFIFSQVTSLTTTFLAVARCMCVAMPFRFKDTFTKSRSIFAQVIFTILGVTTYVPVLTQMGARSEFDPTLNGTRIVLWLSNKRSDFKDVASFTHYTVVVFVSTFIVFICVLVMAEYLRRSVKFRSNMSSFGKAGNDASGKTGNDEKEKPKDKLSGKELQVVRQVVVISIIYTVCMIPSIACSLYRLADSDFDVGKRLQNFYLMMSSIETILSIVNSATTLPVYYAYNSRFRSLLCSSSLGVKKSMAMNSSCDR